MGPACLEISSSGGGGWGDPLDRDPSRVLADVRDGVVSAHAAEDVYGVVIRANSIDGPATESRRAQLRRARGSAAATL